MDPAAVNDMWIGLPSTTVWQTRVTDASGKLLSLTIQTQAVLQK